MEGGGGGGENLLNQEARERVTLSLLLQRKALE